MSKLTGAQHLFFDLDHTLWDFDKNSKLAYEQIFKENAVTLPIDTFIEIYEPLNLEFWRLYRENKISKERLRIERLESAFKACNYNVSKEEINFFSDLYMDYLPLYNHLFDNCIEVLEHLQQAYSLHIITNGFEEVQHTKMLNSKLLPYFNVILTAERAGVKKPDDKIFIQAIEEAGATIENSIMIGDSLAADIEGANRIGMKTIWFNDKNKPVSTDQISISKLKELLDIL